MDPKFDHEMQNLFISYYQRMKFNSRRHQNDLISFVNDQYKRVNDATKTNAAQTCLFSNDKHKFFNSLLNRIYRTFLAILQINSRQSMRNNSSDLTKDDVTLDLTLTSEKSDPGPPRYEFKRQ